ncbi:hypothetical protein LXA43DRAFT_903881 [Ganoderma leucocontextum]|nr:hypothetical protein LXA43DRAFT_903882 [Ganoderma leucocontextum]KAI1783281.1 hypothetical protein LXA43DRAFT_903881 [Ganoderma leucocontextum]
MHDFLELWSCGGPIVVTGVEKRLQGCWAPNDFISDYRDQKVTVIDYTDATEARHRQTVGEFFSYLSTPTIGGRALKLKDWPPQKSFKEAFPDLYDAFCTGVPCPDLACPNGILNLASHFPKNCVPPDLGMSCLLAQSRETTPYPSLGPKMYIAVAAPPNRGTTNLHMDVTDACNLMAWSTRPDSPGAVWDIFRAQDANILRQFMREQYNLTASQDPIHTQSFFLTDEALGRLRDKYNVRAWRIYQRVGEVIYIPAGCAHQVRNVENAIKVACDFVSAGNLSTTESLVSELRARRLLERGDDVLQLYTLLWYAWCSVSAEVALIQEDSMMFLPRALNHAHPECF